MQLKKPNIIFIDMPLINNWEFIKGLEDETKEVWKVKSYVSNQGRTSFLSNFYRYARYFYFSFLIFLNRNKYDKIICWQVFYGIIYAFYCRIFHVKKKNKVIIKNLVYKPKGNSWVGKLYFNWLKYVIDSQYIDLYISASQTNTQYCSDAFGISKDKFKFIPFCVEDATLLNLEDKNLEKSDYILSLGRSNRDWNWLIESFRELSYKLIIIADELRYANLPPNVLLLNNIWDLDTYKYIKYCKCMIIPIFNPSIASGDTVLVRSMSFSKPSIITKPSCLADDYVEDSINALVISKNKNELLQVLSKIYENEKLYNFLSKNARDTYLSKHTIYQYGINMAKQIKSII